MTNWCGIGAANGKTIFWETSSSRQIIFDGELKNYIYGIHKHRLIDLKLYKSPLEHPAGIYF